MLSNHETNPRVSKQIYVLCCVSLLTYQEWEKKKKKKGFLEILSLQVYCWKYSKSWPKSLFGFPVRSYGIYKYFGNLGSLLCLLQSLSNNAIFFYILYPGNDFKMLYVHISMSYSPLDHEALLSKITFYTFVCLSREPGTYLAGKMSL